MSDNVRCTCGAPRHPNDPNRCERGHLIAGNDAAAVVGHRSRSFWLEHAEAKRQIRDAVIVDAGHEVNEAPHALVLAAEGLAQASLIRDSAFARIVEMGGPLTAKSKLRQCFKIWTAAHDRTERHLRLLGIERKSRPVPTFDEELARVRSES